MSLGRRAADLLAALVLGLSLCGAGHAAMSPAELAAAYRVQVDRRLEIPPDEARHYGALALAALKDAGVTLDAAQYLALVDRSPKVQAIFIYWMATDAPPLLIGASPVSTGRGGGFEYFETPLGVFPLSTENPDFRAEGTFNENGIRGYGLKGMRVFDLGWQQAQRLWGRGGFSTMRLQMHATDPDFLEPRLGTVQSKGCIRIPASLNRLLDGFSVLDADYLQAEEAGLSMWVLPPERTPVAGAGRYLVIIDTLRSERPDWSPAPQPAARPGQAAPGP